MPALRTESRRLKAVGVVFCLLFSVFCFLSSAQAAQPVPRVIIGFYDGKQELRRQWTRLHTLAEMPLNHLGLILEYHDINDPLPDIAKRADVRGVLSWLPPGSSLPNPENYFRWAIDVVDAGKKFVIMGGFGLAQIKEAHDPVASILANRFLKKLGLHYADTWVSVTYDVEFLHKDPGMIGFERQFGGILSPFARVDVVDDRVTSHLSAQKKGRPETESHLVVTGPSGGFVAEDYACYESEESGKQMKQWYINPFEFFRLVFATDDLPKPDTTTIAGRRIYYSHIDGDGWLSLTQMEQYRRRPVMAAQVIMDHAIKPFEDLPVTVAPIAAELDPDWVGNEESRRIAKEVLALPQVEIGTHTLSHPFSWEFFADNKPEKERPFLHRYTRGAWSGGEERGDWFIPTFRNKKYEKEAQALMQDYDVPRAYANQPFDLKDEIGGSVEIIEELAPKGKEVKILQWSGDTSPFEAAVQETRKAGLVNMNGGDSRFDLEYPSYAWVAPLGRIVGRERQIYASNSNENTYTELWTGRFYGFKYLKATLDNTERPLRIKPFNIYYHIYSGERQASLYALTSNLEYARTQELAPITASNFAAIGDGFFSTEIIRKDTDVWLVRNRGKLETIRFDDAAGRAVAFLRSRGVIGQRHYQDNLYVYLDEAVEEPVIALKPHDTGRETPKAQYPYLIHGRWKVWNMKRNNGGFRFMAHGFGEGEMRWYVPENGGYSIKADERESIRATAKNNVLTFKLGNVAMEPIEIKISRIP